MTAMSVSKGCLGPINRTVCQLTVRKAAITHTLSSWHPETFHDSTVLADLSNIR